MKKRKKSRLSGLKFESMLTRGIRTFREHADEGKSIWTAIQESLSNSVEAGHEGKPCPACSRAHDPAVKCPERLALEEQLRDQFKKAPLETIRVAIHSKGLERNPLGRRVDRILQRAGVKLPWE